MTGRMLRKICIRLSLTTHTNLTHFLEMTLYDLSEFIEDLQEANEK